MINRQELEKQLNYLLDDTGKWYILLGHPYGADDSRELRASKFIEFIENNYILKK